jgi:hypothetical protein
MAGTKTRLQYNKTPFRDGVLFLENGVYSEFALEEINILWAQWG